MAAILPALSCYTRAGFSPLSLLGPELALDGPDRSWFLDPPAVTSVTV